MHAHSLPAASANPGARTRRTWLRVLALALAPLLGVLACELLLRAVSGAGFGQPRYRFDARYGQIPRDSFVFSFRVDPKRHHAVDLRGQLIPLAHEPGETRVLFLGDSATEGAFVPPERAYPARFEALANAGRAHGRVRAINAGVWGMTPVDELTFLRDKLLPLAPDLVVLGLFMPNDVNMSLAHGRRRLRYQAPSWVERLRERSLLAERLFLAALALNQRHRLVSPATLGSRWVDEPIAQVESHGLHMLSYPAGELALYLRDGSTLVDEAFAVLRETLRQLAQLGRAHGFTLRVLVIPSASSVLGRLSIVAHPGILVELRQQGIAIDPGMLDFQLPLRRVLALCRELELSCVDAAPALRTLGARAFFPRDEHPTSAGHEALAHALLGSP